MWADCLWHKKGHFTAIIMIFFSMITGSNVTNINIPLCLWEDYTFSAFIDVIIGWNYSFEIIIEFSTLPANNEPANCIFCLTVNLTITNDHFYFYHPKFWLPFLNSGRGKGLSSRVSYLYICVFRWTDPCTGGDDVIEINTDKMLIFRHVFLKCDVICEC